MPQAVGLWSYALAKLALAIDLGPVQTHGFSPADMLLGFILQWKRRPILENRNADDVE